MTTRAPDSVLALLGDVAGRAALPALSERLVALASELAGELSGVDAELRALEGGGAALERAAGQLLGAGGKHLRATCLLLAARLGGGEPSAGARSLAVAVELVHAASLLHDDVLDEGHTRRGAPTARVLYGNSVSVLAGDWLLVEALGRVHAVPEGRLAELLTTLRHMAQAESLQLAALDGPAPPVDTCRRIADGKTASLFAWALSAGASSGGAPEAVVQAAAACGRALGLAFQLVDDLLDLEAEAAPLGKDALQDLRPGQANQALALACERDPELAALLAARPGAADALAPWRREVCSRVARSGGLDAARAEVARLTGDAVAALESLADSPARDALAALARGIAGRSA